MMIKQGQTSLVDDSTPAWIREFFNRYGILPIAGGSGEDDDSDDGDENDEGDDDDEDENDDDSGTGGEGSNGKGETISRADYDALMRRMKAADKRASAAEKKVKQKEREEQSELERSQSERDEYKSDAETFAAENRNLMAQVSFLKQKDFKFKNPAAALKLADLSDVFTDDGEIDDNAMKDALKQVADENPYMLVSSDEGDGNEDEENSSKRSGGQVNSGKNQRGKKPDKAALRKKYSNLRR